MRPLTTALVISDSDLRHEIRAALHGAPLRYVLDQPAAIETVQLKRLQLDLVIVAGTPWGETMPELVKRIKAVSPSCAIMLVDSAPEPESILESMRSGAEEFVLPPFETNLQEALLRIVTQYAKKEIASQPGGKVIGFLSAKGGCGATTAACHVAVELERITQQETLLADFDFESGMVGYLMKSEGPYSLADAVRNVHRLDLSYWQGVVTKKRPHLDVISAPDSLPPAEPFRTEQIRETFRIMRAMYGWIVADLGNSLNPISQTLIEDLDELHLLSTMTLPAMYQAKRFIEKVRDHGYPLKKIHLVANRVPQKQEFTPEDCARTLGVPLSAELPESPDLDAAYANGKLLSAGTPLAQELSGLAMQMAGMKLEGASKKSRMSLFGLRSKPVPVYLSLK
jgi:pilus assembly protein CpaE